MGHKGYALGLMVDVLAGALSGTGCPTGPMSDGRNGTGIFMLALNIERFMPREDFAKWLRDMTAWIKTSPPAEGFTEVLIPGEIEHRNRVDRLARGIDVAPNVWTEYQAIVGRLNEAGATTIALPEAVA